jgi:hypothetical protein
MPWIAGSRTLHRIHSGFWANSYPGEERASLLEALSRFATPFYESNICFMNTFPITARHALRSRIVFEDHQQEITPDN